METKPKTDVSEYLAEVTKQIIDADPCVVKHKRKPTQRQYRQQTLASCKRVMMMMRGQTHNLQNQVAAYNKSADSEDRLRTLSTDLNVLQNQLGDILLELNLQFAHMKLETAEKKNQSK